jgi:hypothetical protein
VARTSKGGWFGNLSGIQFGSHAWGYSRTSEEAKSKLLSQKVWVLSVNWWQACKYVRWKRHSCMCSH